MQRLLGPAVSIMNMPLCSLSLPAVDLEGSDKTYSILKKAGRVICRASVLFLRLKGKFLLLQRHFPLLTQRVGGRTGTKQPRLPYPLETSLSSKQNMGAGEGRSRERQVWGRSVGVGGNCTSRKPDGTVKIHEISYANSEIHNMALFNL